MVRFLVGTYFRSDSPFASLLKRLPLNATTKQVLSLPRQEQLAYIENLWTFNAERVRRTEKSPSRSALYDMPLAFGLLRRYNQLPCTLETRKARADLLQDFNPAVSRILLLGDDDLVSVELAQRGFAKVTVADCDGRLLTRIGHETARTPDKPELVRADFTAANTSLGLADAVFLDPPYSLDGVRAFLSFAVKTVASRGQLYLMVNPGILGSGFTEIVNWLGRQGFSLKSQRRGFNAYPLGTLESLVLKTAWRLALGRPAPKVGQLLFCSDCLQFEKID